MPSKNSKTNKNRKFKVAPSRQSEKKDQSAIMRIERMDHPPQIDSYNITHNIRLRYTVTAAAATNISYANILDSILIATSAVAGFDLFDVVKIKSLEVWSQAALGTPSTITVTYITATGDRNIHTDTSLGVKPAYIKAIPSRRSLASFWNASAAGGVFSITCPAGSIVDCNFVFRTTNALAVAAANALVGATIGELYYRGLDGLAAAGTNFPPIAGVATI